MAASIPEESPAEAPLTEHRSAAAAASGAAPKASTDAAGAAREQPGVQPAAAHDATSPTWMDATPLLRAASEALQPGQLLHSDSFSLFESISAVEIGDPRMDAGAMQGLQTAEQLVADGAAPLALSDAQVLGMMDRLAALEAAWHAGHFLAQSIYSCLYMLLPNRAAQVLPLAAFCKAVRGTCNTVRSLSLASNVCLDEDIMPHAFGLDVDDSFCTVAGSTKPLAGLSLAEDKLNATARQKSPAANSKQQQQQQQQEQAPPSSQQSDGGEANSRDVSGSDPAFRTALLARLRFRRSLHQALEKLQGFAGQPDLDSTAKHLVAAQGELQRVRDSAHLAAADDAAVDGAFSADVNRMRMSPTPPRSMPVPTAEQTWEHYEGLLRRLLVVCRIGSVSSWRQLQIFLRDFADMQPGSIERAAMHVVVRGGKRAGSGGLPPAGVPPWTPRPTLLATATGLPPGPPWPCPEAETFLEQATIVTQNWCQAMCLNPARTRRRLRRLLVDWHHLSGHAANADCTPETQAALEAAGWRWQGLGSDDPQGQLGTWVEVEAAGVMLQHLLLGCRQALYAPREFSMLYWYCDYLHSIALEGSHALSAAAPRPEPKASKSQAGKRRPGGKASKASAKAAAEAKEDELQRAIKGRLPEPASAPEGAPAQRFDQRFAAFHALARPEPLGYQQFAESMDTSEVTAEQLLALAERSWLKTRTHAQLLAANFGSGLSPGELASLQELQQVAIRNVMALQIFAQTMRSGSDSLRLSWDCSHHLHYPVISVKR